MRRLRQRLQFRDSKKPGLFMSVMISIPMLWVLLHLMRIPRLLKWLDQPKRERKSLEQKDLDLSKSGWLYANFLLIKCLRLKKPCLLRSLVLFQLLRKRGLDSQIHFGVKREDFLDGHSWVSFNGKPLLERTDPNLIYEDIYVYPHGGRAICSVGQNDSSTADSEQSHGPLPSGEVGGANRASL